MPRLLEINVASNNGSTGRIAESIGLLSQTNGWECFIAHGSRYSRRTSLDDLSIGSIYTESLHYLKSFFFDSHGLGSVAPTKKLIDTIKNIKPAIVHLHNIHGYYINYDILFTALKELNIPVVWTLHDCWSFTGHCTYFDIIQCEKWKVKCDRCPQRNSYPKSLIDRSSRNFNLKKKLFTSVERMAIVPVSEWLSGLVSNSYLKDYPRYVIHNGIDLSVFHPSEESIKDRLGYRGKKIVLGVADGFGDRKGLGDFITLRKILPSDYEIVLIGVSDSDKKRLPETILAIPKTESQKVLVDYYSAADVFINPTYEDNFPTTNIEALACGTPVITYATGGSPEAIDSNTGRIVEKGNVVMLRDKIVDLCNDMNSEISSLCRRRVELFFDKDKCYHPYMELFNSLL